MLHLDQIVRGLVCRRMTMTFSDVIVAHFWAFYVVGGMYEEEEK